MHAVSFQTKRAHLSVVAFGRKVVEGVPDMTPARFDLMYAVRCEAFAWRGIAGRNAGRRQSDVVRMLGLHPSTVCKTVKRLVELGWLTQERDSDGRTRFLALTPLGIARIERAMRIVFHQRTHLKEFEALFKAQRSDLHPLEAIHEHWSTVDVVARHFGDSSALEYDFGYREKFEMRPEDRQPADPTYVAARIAATELHERAARARNILVDEEGYCAVTLKSAEQEAHERENRLGCRAVFQDVPGRRSYVRGDIEHERLHYETDERWRIEEILAAPRCETPRLRCRPRRPRPLLKRCMRLPDSVAAAGRSAGVLICNCTCTRNDLLQRCLAGALDMLVARQLSPRNVLALANMAQGLLRDPRRHRPRLPYPYP